MGQSPVSNTQAGRSSDRPARPDRGLVTGSGSRPRRHRRPRGTARSRPPTPAGECRPEHPATASTRPSCENASDRVEPLLHTERRSRLRGPENVVRHRWACVLFVGAGSWASRSTLWLACSCTLQCSAIADSSVSLYGAGWLSSIAFTSRCVTRSANRRLGAVECV